MGYHKKKIKKGVLGKFSKIKEEFEELKDAKEQGDKILILCELSDLQGAIEEYIKQWNLTLYDLKLFSDKTKMALREGKR
jgi:phosphoribosyl-ATP pyrophosphohydrolase